MPKGTPKWSPETPHLINASVTLRAAEELNYLKYLTDESAAAAASAAGAVAVAVGAATGDGAAAGDAVEIYFGYRSVGVGKDKTGTPRIFLNGSPYYSLGVLDQGWYPDGLYAGATDEALLFDLKILKSMGYNSIRKHMKVIHPSPLL